MGCFVKICGIANAADVRAVAELRPDAMGFVFWAGSRRAVKADDVGAWLRDVPTGIKRVGVFVDAAPDDVLQIMERAGLDAAQLHGHETAAAFAGFPKPIWRAVSLRPGMAPDLSGWSVDAYLVDTYSSQAPGGTGQVGDWPAARVFVAHSAKPVLLAGGLTPENVREALRTVKPWGADVSSGVEAGPGRKDLDKVRRFIEQCRAE